jgi:hypothetical protein
MLKIFFKMKDDSTYIKGFNNGYIISKFSPNLFKSISDTLSISNPYTEGMKDGQEEYEIEQGKAKYENLERLRNTTVDRGFGCEIE